MFEPPKNLLKSIFFSFDRFRLKGIYLAGINKFSADLSSMVLTKLWKLVLRALRAKNWKQFKPKRARLTGHDIELNC